MVIAALFKTAKMQKQPENPWIDTWIKKMWYMYTKDYYLAFKRSEILQFVTTWMDAVSILLSEISQTEKHKYHMTSLIGGI